MSDFSIEALDWGEEVSSEEVKNEIEFSLLKDGDYSYRITKFEKGHFNGSAKCPACNKAMVTLLVSGDKCSNMIHESFLLTKNNLSRIYKFFVSTGLIKKDFSGVFPWDSLEGMEGRCTVTTREYEKDGEKKHVNAVKKWLEPSSAEDTEEEEEY